MGKKLQEFISVAESYLGTSTGTKGHRELIDIYNTIDPLPRDYRMSTSDPWCAAFISAIAKKCDLTNIIYPECSCSMMLRTYLDNGNWIEDESMCPKVGDLCFYCWSDPTVKDDCITPPDHVGFVYYVSSGKVYFKTIEGNRNGTVTQVLHTVNEQYLRGFARPKWFLVDKTDHWGECTACDINSTEPSGDCEMCYAKDFVVDNRIFIGDEKGFRWDEPMTREEFAVALQRFYFNML